VAVAWAAATAPPTAAGTAERRGLLVDGGARHYWLAPPGVAGPVPTVLVLQGALEDPLAFAASTGLPALARQGGFALVIPEPIDGHWNDGRRSVYFGSPSAADDAGFLKGLLAALVAEGVARADSIYLAGFSNGGLMALTLACRPGAVRPAGLVIAAAMLTEATAAGCRPPVPLTLVLANGTADPLFPYSGGTGMGNGRAGEPMLSAAATAGFFARVNGCGDAEVVAHATRAKGRGEGVAVTGFAGCPKDGLVLQVTVTGGGHAWPSVSAMALGDPGRAARPVTLAELAWSVFRSGSAAWPQRRH
jgi:polyhydroxybutyrate depolymerase